jgi:hypothetical protein
VAPIPPRLAAGIDQIAGPGKRTAFVVDVLERDIRRREQLEALRDAVRSWKDDDHPELANGSEARSGACARNRRSASRRFRSGRPKRFLRSLRFHPTTFEIAIYAGGLRSVWRSEIARCWFPPTARTSRFRELSIHPVAG